MPCAAIMTCKLKHRLCPMFNKRLKVGFPMNELTVKIINANCEIVQMQWIMISRKTHALKFIEMLENPLACFYWLLYIKHVKSHFMYTVGSDICPNASEDRVCDMVNFTIRESWLIKNENDIWVLHCTCLLFLLEKIVFFCIRSF